METSRSVISGETTTTVNSNPESGSSETMQEHGMHVVELADHSEGKLAPPGGSGYFSASSDDMSSSDEEGNSDYRRRQSQSSSGSTSTLESVTGRKDTRIAARLRLLVAALFLSMGIVFPIIIYKTTLSNEVDAFEEQFVGLAIKLIGSVENGLSRKFSSLESLRIATSSHVQVSDSTWPFVTLPDYDLRAESVRDLGGLLSVSFHPLVTVDEKQNWEAYSVANIEWLTQSINRTVSRNGIPPETLLVPADHLVILEGYPQSGKEASDAVVCRSPVTSLGFPQEIYNLEPNSQYGACVDEGKDSTYPLWQSHPPVAAAINMNALSFPDSMDAVQHLKNTGDAVLSRIQFPDLNNESISHEVISEGMVHHLLGLDETMKDALALIYYPIFQDFDISPNDVVGMFASVIKFEEFFTDVLPSATLQTESLVCVVENNCGDVVSYLVIGNRAQYVGRFDTHNSYFNNLVHQYKFEWPPDSVKMGGAKEEGVGLDQDFCPYMLSVYPHDDMYDSHLTSQPIIFATTFAFAIFAVTVTALTYDYFVQRRMKRAVKSAKENRAIVSRLFPENIRTRMIQEVEDRKRAEEGKRRLSSDGTGRRNSNEESRRNSVDGRRRASNEGRRRLSNEREKRRLSNEGERRRFSNERESRWMNPDLGGISDYIPIINAVGTVGNAVGNVGHAVVEFTSMALAPAKMRLRSFLKEDKESAGDVGSQHYDPGISIHSSFEHETKPIADLFPHCTVLFADISGFTAWSSEREPTQVFTLLQAIFHKFDTLARKRDIFKVETIGDCYVAVTGLPDPQPDHAVRMTKFARACIHKFTSVVKRLETQLGPGTSDLRMRFGLHSGPVTAGVLRGEKSRFQLFGDTVNTASRMESTGQRNRIQISQRTAQHLIESGKENWIQRREDLVHAKGKGAIQTYWVLTRKQKRLNAAEHRPRFIQPSLPDSASDLGSIGSGNLSDWAIEDLDDSARDQFEAPSVILSAHVERLIDWQVDLLLRLVKQIIAGRDQQIATDSKSTESKVEAPDEVGDAIPVESITESIELPEFDPEAAHARVRTSTVDIPQVIISELRAFVTMIATRYRDNPFHCFAHAAHVSMSCQKILNRVVAPEDVNYRRDSINAVASDLHEYTYGITSDPLTQLAIMIATLAHDVDHTGVPNPQRNKEEPDLAKKYQSRSIAEQNSIDMAWSLLMSPKLQNLYEAIFTSKREVRRFRQLLVNLIMATDIFEPNQKAARDARWEKVFHSDLRDKVEGGEYRTLKASIVIEHIIQAADVSHTMQHWQVYVKWNERLFQEMYRAFESGRSEKDPSEGWYKGEIWFFDNYVIPLAKKLDECGVFGVTSDECLNYAMQNRLEWEAKGEQIVKEMVERVKAPKRVLSRAARRNSFGYMARRSATFMMPAPMKSSSTVETKYGNDSDEESLHLSVDSFDGPDQPDETPTANNRTGVSDKTPAMDEQHPPTSLAPEFDCDDDDSVVVDA